MDITIHATFLPHDDPDAALAFYRDVLGFEVRNDVGYAGLRWITVGPPGQPGTSIVLQPPAPPGCGATDDERRAIAEMMAKGSYACITLATKDLDGTFERLEASGAEVVQGDFPGARGRRPDSTRAWSCGQPLLRGRPAGVTAVFVPPVPAPGWAAGLAVRDLGYGRRSLSQSSAVWATSRQP